MIKAKKSFIPALLALMMVFAFMPAMAFAGTGTQAVKSFDATSTYGKVTDENDVVFDTTRTFTKADGKITATGEDNSNTTVLGEQKPAPAGTFAFFDATGAYLATGTTKIDGTTVTQAFFDNMLANMNLTLVEPGYAEGFKTEGHKADVYPATVSTLKTTGEGTAVLGPWTVTVKMSDYTKGATNDQQVTFTVTSALTVPGTEITGAAGKEDLVGSVADATATVTVKGATIDPTTAKFYLDTVDPKATSDVLTGLYDGAEHTVVVDPVEGYTVSYQIKNMATGKWDAASAVTIKDAGSVTFKPVFTKNGTETVGATKTVTLAAVDPAYYSVGFVKTKDTGAVYDVVGSEYNAADYVDVIAVAAARTDSDAVAEKKAAAKAAVEANKAEIIALFNDYFEIEATTAKGSTTPATLKIYKKKLQTADETALDTKYDTLMTNMGIAKPVTVAGLVKATDDIAATATLNLNSELVDEEIEFVDSPTAVTYKAKKLKKKAASFTVTAISNKGRAVSYKLINAPAKITIDKATGEITLAKGLKKGKYNVTVKAYIPGAPLLFETQDIMIKVKK